MWLLRTNPAVVLRSMLSGSVAPIFGFAPSFHVLGPRSKPFVHTSTPNTVVRGVPSGGAPQ
eukprot:7104040-Prymnesium_polylepis.1